MTLQVELQNLGLKENEAIVYVAIVKLGETTISALERETELHKQIIYNMIEELLLKNLVQIHYEGRGKKFSVSNLAELEQLIARKLSSAHVVTGQLMKLANQVTVTDSIKTYRAQSGIWHYYKQKILLQPPQSTILFLAENTEKYFEIFPLKSTGFIEYEKIREAQKINLHGIVFDGKGKEKGSNIKRNLVEIKALQNKASSPHDLIIWETSVGLLFYTDEPYIIDINGKSTADGFRSYFKAIWNTN